MTILPAPLLAPITPGELIDKITILRIKLERIADATKLVHVRAELAALEALRNQAFKDSDELTNLISSLRAVNETLWEVEDELRVCERDGDFGPRFVELARSVYRRNDERSQLKQHINELLGAPFSEQKSYVQYNS